MKKEKELKKFNKNRDEGDELKAESLDKELKKTQKYNNILKTLLIILVIVITLALMKFLPHEQIKTMILNAGKLAPLVYIGLFTILPVFFFPVPVLAIAGGLAFGLIEGTIYTLIGAGLNCIIMFLLARYAGKESMQALVEKKLGADMKKKFDNSGNRAFWLIFFLRLIPLVPYNIINYGAGLTDIRFRDYTLASILGIIPGTLVFLNLGDKSSDLYSKDFIIASILMVLLILVSTALSKLISKRQESEKLYPKDEKVKN